MPTQDRMEAIAIPPGSLVMAELDGKKTPCLKAVRPGKDFLNHYLIPLDGRDDLTLLYVDPDDILTVHHDTVLVLGDGLDREEPGIGDILERDGRRYLKVFDEAASLRHFAYVDIENGEIRRRQERDMTGVFGWKTIPKG